MTNRVVLGFTRRLLLLAAGSMTIAATTVSSQTNLTLAGATPKPEDAAIKLPAFEVVSIKPDKSGENGIRLQFTPDGFRAINVPLYMIIREAYNVEDDQISGEPSWIKSQRYDIEAKVDGADVATLKKLTFDQRKLMLQPLLADRLKLTIHHETKDLSVYALVIAKSGLKLKEATPDDPYPNGVKGPDGVARGAGMMMMSHGQLTGQAIQVSSLVKFLSEQQLGRMVLDKTGLTAKYDFVLKWAPEQGPAPISAAPQSNQQSAPPPIDSSGPSLFTAIQEQLGLKLESQKAPVETLVIDHVEPPSEN